MRFADGVSTVALGDVLLLEVGPGRTLADLARHAATGGRPAAAYSSLGREGDEAPDERVILAIARSVVAGRAPGSIGAVSTLTSAAAACDCRRIRFNGSDTGSIRHRRPLSRMS